MLCPMVYSLNFHWKTKVSSVFPSHKYNFPLNRSTAYRHVKCVCKLFCTKCSCCFNLQRENHGISYTSIRAMQYSVVHSVTFQYVPTFLSSTKSCTFSMAPTDSAWRSHWPAPWKWASSLTSQHSFYAPRFRVPPSKPKTGPHRGREKYIGIAVSCNTPVPVPYW